jgi:hypothetical protein
VVDDGSIRDGYKREIAWPAALAEASGLGAGKPRDLAAVVRALRPTALIGTSGEPDTFGEDVVREMARHVARPVILPLSNPTSQAEAKPKDVLTWTNGRALVATGSPFEPVQLGERPFVIGQGNNAFVFPGVGLGTMVAEAREVTDGMLMAAAMALAEEVRDEDLAAGSLYPPVNALRRVTTRVAEGSSRPRAMTTWGDVSTTRASPRPCARRCGSRSTRSSFPSDALGAEALHHPEHAIDVERFREVALGAEAERRLRAAPLPRAHDHWNLGEPRVVELMPPEGCPVHVGHHQVEQDHTGYAVFPEPRECFQAVTGHHHNVAFRLKHERQRLAHLGIVVDYQDRSRPLPHLAEPRSKRRAIPPRGSQRGCRTVG